MLNAALRSQHAASRMLLSDRAEENIANRRNFRLRKSLNSSKFHLLRIWTPAIHSSGTPYLQLFQWKLSCDWNIGHQSSWLGPEGSRKTEPNEQKEDLPKDDPDGATGTTRISDPKLNSWEVLGGPGRLTLVICDLLRSVDQRPFSVVPELLLVTSATLTYETLLVPTSGKPVRAVMAKARGSQKRFLQLQLRRVWGSSPHTATYLHVLSFLRSLFFSSHCVRSPSWNDLSTPVNWNSLGRQTKTWRMHVQACVCNLEMCTHSFCSGYFSTGRFRMSCSWQSSAATPAILWRAGDPPKSFAATFFCCTWSPKR